ncbi:hypothetical protein pEaSNUABM6_00215 [Erwinia phage pEa_SNUABM_6]|nr:hypothetical protein pEaSNUABM6_00215 [Erwinia phage pEa_SNUABM_6]
MFHASVIEALVTRIQSRDFAYPLNALNALSNLVVLRNAGLNTVTVQELDALLHCELEKVFPLPAMQITVDGVENTVSINGHKFHHPDEEAMKLTWRPHPAWGVVVKDEAGVYQLIASADPYRIPRGQLSIPFDYAEYETSMGAIKQDNMLISRGQVIWEIRSWQDVSKILNSHEYFEMGISRRQPQLSDESPTLLGNEDDLKTTFVDVALLEERGLVIGPYGNSVLELVDRLIKVEDETVKVDIDEEQMAITAMIHKALDWDGLLAKLQALPAKKRTRAQVRNALTAFLAQGK